MHKSKDMSKLHHVKSRPNEERATKDYIEDIASGLEEKKEAIFNRDRAKKSLIA